MNSTDQNPARQIEAIRQVEEVFTDQVSGGSRTTRTALAPMLRHARRGDTLRVASMDRLAQSVVDLAQIVVELTGRRVTGEFVAERLSIDPGGEDPFATFQLRRPDRCGRRREASEAEVEQIRRSFVEQFSIPAGRIGKIADIGYLVAFLASPAGSYITGTHLAVDGGLMPTL